MVYYLKGYDQKEMSKFAGSQRITENIMAPYSLSVFTFPVGNRRPDPQKAGKAPAKMGLGFDHHPDQPFRADHLPGFRQRRGIKSTLMLLK